MDVHMQVDRFAGCSDVQNVEHRMQNVKYIHTYCTYFVHTYVHRMQDAKSVWVYGWIVMVQVVILKLDGNNRDNR